MNLPETITVQHITEWLESLPPKTVVQAYEHRSSPASQCCVVTTYAKSLDPRVRFSTDRGVNAEDGEKLAYVSSDLGRLMYNGFDKVRPGLPHKLEAHEALSIIDEFEGRV